MFFLLKERLTQSILIQRQLDVRYANLAGITTNLDGGYIRNGTTLQVTGLSTFGNNVNITGNLDVDGHTELDDVNVSGALHLLVLDFNGSLDVDGHTELDDLNVSGVSTFTGAIDANGSLDVDGHTELDDVNVSGASTFTGALMLMGL